MHAGTRPDWMALAADVELAGAGLERIGPSVYLERAGARDDVHDPLQPVERLGKRTAGRERHDPLLEVGRAGRPVDRDASLGSVPFRTLRLHLNSGDDVAELGRHFHLDVTASGNDF